MTKIFEQFKNGEEAQDLGSAHTSEERTYTIIKPSTNKEILVQHCVKDCVEDEGYTKRIQVSVVECGCCGALASYDPETRYKPPAGRCQNPECRGLICHRCTEQTYYCAVCRKPLCPACMFQTQQRSITFCREHFKEFAEKANRKEIEACLTKEPDSRRG